ncbi:hypothetical protein L208DRAFT_1380342 [Tricholoma matsutake]|nr:hypothetical protein L208DRAFT_1380342 [Tricholoma matsutake 945]
MSSNFVVHTRGTNYFTDIISSGTSLTIVITPSGPGSITLNFKLYHPTIISATSAAEVIIHAGSTTHSTKHSVPCMTPSNNTAHPKDNDSVTEPELDDVIPEENGSVMESEEEEEVVPIQSLGKQREQVEWESKDVQLKKQSRT